MAVKGAVKGTKGVERERERERERGEESNVVKGAEHLKAFFPISVLTLGTVK